MLTYIGFVIRRFGAGKYLSDHVSVEIEEEAGSFERHKFPVRLGLTEPEMAALEVGKFEIGWYMHGYTIFGISIWAEV